MGVSHALLQRAGDASIPSVLRVYVPGATMAFGRLDALRPGYSDAASAARSHGFEPVLRLGGGHAAAYDRGSVIVETIVPAAAMEGIQDRFEAETGALVEAIAAVGVDARVGELEREYCAGRWSINIDGRVKIAGTSQRIVRGAALTTAVVIVEGTERIRPALVDVYDALGIDWDPSTAGAMTDFAQSVATDVVRAAVIDAYESRGVLTRSAGLDAAVLELAHELEPQHAVA
jgi:lipoate-protein ligase A